MINHFLQWLKMISRSKPDTYNFTLGDPCTDPPDNW